MTSEQYKFLDAFEMTDSEILNRLKIVDAGGDACITVTSQSDGVFCAMFWDVSANAGVQSVTAAGFIPTDNVNVIDPHSGTPYGYVWFKDV